MTGQIEGVLVGGSNSTFCITGYKAVFLFLSATLLAVAISVVAVLVSVEQTTSGPVVSVAALQAEALCFIEADFAHIEFSKWDLEGETELCAIEQYSGTVISGTVNQFNFKATDFGVSFEVDIYEGCENTDINPENKVATVTCTAEGTYVEGTIDPEYLAYQAY